MLHIAVTFQPGFKARADFVAEQIGIPVIGEFTEKISESRLLLKVDETGLTLLLSENPKSGIRAEFLSGANNHRRFYGGGKNQLIGKASGLATGYKPSVLDMTAGLGRDAFVLATLGAEVTLCENNPVVYWLLRDGIERALNDQDTDTASQEILGRMKLKAGDSLKYLAGNPEPSPDVIYLDPMFPARSKSARVRKEMALLHELMGVDQVATEVLQAALDAAKYRVVVKRPSHADFLEDRKPGYSLKGKSVRFDVYPIRKFPDK